MKIGLITEENLNDCREQDLEALEYYLFESEDAMIDITPVPITIKKTLKKTMKNYLNDIKHRIIKNMQKNYIKLSNMLVSLKTFLYNSKQNFKRYFYHGV